MLQEAQAVALVLRCDPTLVQGIGDAEELVCLILLIGDEMQAIQDFGDVIDTQQAIGDARKSKRQSTFYSMVLAYTLNRGGGTLVKLFCNYWKLIGGDLRCD